MYFLFVLEGLKISFYEYTTVCWVCWRGYGNRHSKYPNDTVVCTSVVFCVTISIAPCCDLAAECCKIHFFVLPDTHLFTFCKNRKLWLLLSKTSKEKKRDELGGTYFYGTFDRGWASSGHSLWRLCPELGMGSPIWVSLRFSFPQYLLFQFLSTGLFHIWMFCCIRFFPMVNLLWGNPQSWRYSGSCHCDTLFSAYFVHIFWPRSDFYVSSSYHSVVDLGPKYVFWFVFLFLFGL